MGDPLELVEVARMFGMSRSTMWELVRELGLQKYRKRGRGKTTFIDPDEVRAKLRPRPIAGKSDA